MGNVLTWKALGRTEEEAATDAARRRRDRLTGLVAKIRAGYSEKPLSPFATTLSRNKLASEDEVQTARR